MKTYNYYYVYRISNIITGMHYYGDRACNCHPKEDLGISYFSSYTNKLFEVDQKNNPNHYKYKIIKIFETQRSDAKLLESFLHKKFDVKNHPLFINRANQTSKKFDTTGRKYKHKESTKKLISKKLKESDLHKEFLKLLAKKHKGKSTFLNLDTNEYEFITLEEKEAGNYTTLNKNKITVFSLSEEKTLKVDLSEFENNDDLVSINKGKILAREINSGNLVQVSKEEFKNNYNLVNWNKGYVTIFDKKLNKNRNVTKEEFENNTDLVSIKKNMIEVYDIKSKIQDRVTYDTFINNEYLFFRKKNFIRVLNIFTGKNSLIKINEFDDMIHTRYFHKLNIVRTLENKFRAVNLTRDEILKSKEYGLATQKAYKIIKPNGESIITFSIYEFIKIHNLPSTFPKYKNKGVIKNVKIYNDKNINGWEIREI